MKYHVMTRTTLDADTAAAAASEFVRQLKTTRSIDVAVTGPPRTGTTFFRVTDDDVERIAGT